MNRNANIAALIEKNRLALLRMVFCWLSAAYALNVRGDRPLPRRLAEWVEELISKAENATAFLIIGLFYHSQIDRRHNPAFEKAARCLLFANGTIMLGALTISGIIQRLKALQFTLHNLRIVARRVAKSLASLARVAALKLGVFAAVQARPVFDETSMPENTLPP